MNQRQTDKIWPFDDESPVVLKEQVWPQRGGEVPG